MIAHPPCTYLAVSGARWFYHPADKDLPVSERRAHPDYKDRAKHRDEALKFFIKLTKVPIEKIAIENPIGIVSSRFRKPDQIVQPYMFGDEATKTTCLWLYGLPLLKETKLVGKGDRIEFSSGKSQPKWYSDAFVKAKTPEERRTLRSKTFPGLAKEMAKGLIESNIAGETFGNPRDQEGESGESEDYSDSEKPRGVLRIPRNIPDPPADGNI
jgi:hypothetical protein